MFCFLFFVFCFLLGLFKIFLLYLYFLMLGCLFWGFLCGFLCVVFDVLGGGGGCLIFMFQEESYTLYLYLYFKIYTVNQEITASIKYW